MANLNKYAEYVFLSEKYTFLTKQLETLQKAKLEIAKEINAELEKRGIENYDCNKLGYSFEKYYVSKWTINSNKLKKDKPTLYKKFLVTSFDERTFKSSEEAKELKKTNPIYFEKKRVQTSTLIKTKKQTLKKVLKGLK